MADFITRVVLQYSMLYIEIVIILYIHKDLSYLFPSPSARCYHCVISQFRETSSCLILSLTVHSTSLLRVLFTRLLTLVVIHNSFFFSRNFYCRKKRCLRRKYPDLGWNFNSLTNLSEQLSEEEIIFERTNLNCGMRTSMDSTTHKPKPNPPSYQLAATHFDAQSPWTLTDTPTSTPLMAVSGCSDFSGENVCVAVDFPETNPVSEGPPARTIVDLSEPSPVSFVVDTPEADSSAVVDIPDLSSPDTSFTCSSLSDVFSLFSGTPQSSSSLTSVSSLDMTSAKPEASSLIITELETHCSSPTANSTEALEPKPELNYHHVALATVEPEVVTDPPSSEPSVPLTIEPESSLPTAESHTLLETSPLKYPATPKHSSSFDLSPSASDKSTRTVSLATESGSSSRESCKTPVAATGDVILTIQDDEDEVVLHASKKSRAETTTMRLKGEDEKHVARLVESTASDTPGVTINSSGLTGNVKDNWEVTAENGLRGKLKDGLNFENVVIDLSGAASEKESDVIEVDEVIIEISDVTSEGKDGFMVVENATLEISGLTSGDKNLLTMTMGPNRGGKSFGEVFHFQ